MAGTSAEDFIGEVLVRRLGAHGVVTGDDFTFGKGAKGNVALLRELGGELGLECRTVGVVMDGGGVISSSRIREALRAGDPREAARLLSRPFAIRGIVEHGDKRGRDLGYPTANLAIDAYLRPRYGIYAVTGRILASGEEIGRAHV